MRSVSEQLIERINNYILRQKVSLEAVFVLIDRDLRIYSEEIRDHIRKYAQYLIWLDDNHKDTKNAWEKYISRLEWLENKNKNEQEESNRMHRLVQDLEQKEAMLKQKKENEKRIDSISKGFWKDQVENEKENLQMAFEEVVLSNGETVITTLIEEPVEVITQTSEQLQISEDDYLNTILTEDIFEEAQLEKIMKTSEFIEENLEQMLNIDLEDFDNFNLKKNELTSESTIQEVLFGHPELTQDLNESKTETKIETSLTNDEILDQIEQRLDNPESQSYVVDDTEQKSDYDISTSDYFMFDSTQQDNITKEDLATNIEGNDVLYDNTFVKVHSVPSQLFNDETIDLNGIDEHEKSIKVSQITENEPIESMLDETTKVFDEPDSSYLNIKKFDDRTQKDFVLNETEKTLFDSPLDEGAIDQSMFEDSTLQTFAEDPQPTLDALDFLNNLEEKYSTLLDFDPDMLSDTTNEMRVLQDRTTNTLDALKFVDQMDSKYADILTDDPNASLTVEENLIDIEDEVE